MSVFTYNKIQQGLLGGVEWPPGNGVGLINVGVSLAIIAMMPIGKMQPLVIASPMHNTLYNYTTTVILYTTTVIL